MKEKLSLKQSPETELFFLYSTELSLDILQFTDRSVSRSKMKEIERAQRET